MKTPAILLLAISCLLFNGGSTEAASVKVITLEDSITNRSIGDKIKEALEILKKQMKTGNPKLGIPVLEPIDLEHQKINIQEEIFKLQGSVDDVYVEGLSNYTVQFADFTIAKWNLTIDILWNSIKGKDTYDLDGLVFKVPIYGTGDIDFEVKGFRFTTQAQLKLNRIEKKISIVNFNNTVIGLDSVKMVITGFFNDNELSALISAVISENAQDIIKNFQKQLTTEVDKLMLKHGNEMLGQISLDDILGIIS